MQVWGKMRKGRGREAHSVFISAVHRVMRGPAMHCGYTVGETVKADLILTVGSRAKIGQAAFQDVDSWKTERLILPLQRRGSQDEQPL